MPRFVKWFCLKSWFQKTSLTNPKLTVHSEIKNSRLASKIYQLLIKVSALKEICMHYRTSKFLFDVCRSSNAHQNGGKMVSKIQGRTNQTADEIHQNKKCTSIFV